MNEQPFAISIEEMYGDPGLDEATIEVILARSLDPRAAYHSQATAHPGPFAARSGALDPGTGARGLRE